MKHFPIVLLLFLFPLANIHAIYDPLIVPNNRYGILMIDTNSISDVPPLVNSSNGDWGYVTLVIPDNDRNIGKWQGIFDQMRRLHLIPIVRLATHTEGSSWLKPSKEDAGSWVEFLSKLNWPIKNRYVSLFNEPNHAKEWGNTINPEEYASLAVTFAHALKSSSEDYFILQAGLDGSASSNNDSLDESEFLRRMYTAKPELFTILDGWTSHSYPNPGFSGSPYASGKGTIRGFEWELQFLRQLGVQKTLPIFITETGWEHSEGKNFNARLNSSQTVGDYMKISADTLWKDPRIVAIAPFVFNYQDVPFDHFSWRKYQSTDYYDQYYSYQSIPKIKGEPVQSESFSLENPLIPDTFVTNASYSFTTNIINEGQSILDQKDGYELHLDTGNLPTTLFVEALPYIEPKQKGKIIVHIKIPPKLGIYTFSLSLNHNNRVIPLESKEVSIIPPPKATIYAELGWKKDSEAQNITVLVYNDTHEVVGKFQDVAMSNGIIQIPAIENILPEQRYRVVVLVPYYLPRQAIVILHKDTTDIRLKRFLPLDFDRDGKLSILDFIPLIYQKPSDTLRLFF